MGEIKVPEPSTVSMGMVEKATVAICIVADQHVAAIGRGRAEKFARAAIEALREPTEAMLAAVDARSSYPLGSSTATEAPDADEAWRLMIDAALTPPEEMDGPNRQ